MSFTVDREQVIQYRFRRHELDRPPGAARGPTDVAILRYGVQETGTEGAAWALVNRGLDRPDVGELLYAWTLRGAPHTYRRADAAKIAVATAPFSEADAGKRILRAAAPLKAAGVTSLDGLRTVAEQMRAIVVRPTGKGDVSRALTARLDKAFLRFCPRCDATHVYELPFRLAALAAGLELEPGTSPPVLRRVPKLRAPLVRKLADEADPDLDVIRNHLHFFGPTRARAATDYVEGAVKDGQRRWPADVVEVPVRTDSGPARFVLADDLDELTSTGPAGTEPTMRLLGAFDPYLALRDRELLVPDAAHRKDLWRTIGRPGAIVADGEVLGSWRPRASGNELTVRLNPWRRLSRTDRDRVDEQAERLAAYRGLRLSGVTTD